MIFGLGVVATAVIIWVGYLGYAWYSNNTSIQGTAANIAQVVSILSIIIAFAALVYAKGQIEAARELQRRTYARDIYRDYLKVAFENPILADPTDSLQEFNYKELKIGSSRELFAKYEWYLSFVLEACEQLRRLPADEGWEDTVRFQIGYHYEWLLTVRAANYLEQCPEEFREYVLKVAREKKTEMETKSFADGPARMDQK